jgi:antitoxin VapB
MHTLIVIVRGDDMAETAIARLFTHGRSQAVRLPKEFRLPGDRVRFRRVGDGVLLEPLAADVDTWFAELDRFADTPLFDDSRDQPSTPTGEDILSELPARHQCRGRAAAQQAVRRLAAH